MGSAKRTIKRISVFLLVFTWLFSVSVWADNIDDRTQEFRIEQAHATIPEIVVYYYADKSIDQSVDTIQATYAGEKLTGKSVEQYDKQQGVDYYFLLDISASIADGYFEDMKMALPQMCASMNGSDSLTLITFGDEVEVIFEKKKKTDDISSYMEGISNDDMTTSLFQAIDKTAQMAEKDPDYMRRKVVVVMTDGEDYTINKSTNKEALDTLARVSMPVYSIAVEKTTKGADNPYINDFGEFTRQSGGMLYVLQEEGALGVLSEIRTVVDSARVATLLTATNRTTMTPQPLTLAFGDMSPRTINLLATHAVADESVPTAKAEQSSNKSFTVTFSEKVIGADRSDHYVVKKEDGTVLPVALVTYSESGEYRAVLNFEDEFYNGDYEISYQDITDDSAEANLVSSVNLITVTDGLEEESDFVKFMRQYWPLLAAIAAVLLVLAIVLIIYRRISKRGGTVVHNGETFISDQIKQKVKINVEKQPAGHEIQFIIRGEGKKENVYPITVSGSLIVGRNSELCGLSFNDEHISKQHFVIEEREDGFYISDLNSGNGTMVNGVRITKTRKLNQNDMITAGKIDMRVRW